MSQPAIPKVAIDKVAIDLPMHNNKFPKYFLAGLIMYHGHIY